jgi:hypothetical protein
MGYDHNARAFKDLAEFLNHFLFLCSIHSFTPILGITPRLSFAKETLAFGVRDKGPRPKSPEGYALR